MMAWILGAIEPLAKCVPSARYWLGFGEGHPVDPFLIWFSKIEGHLLDRGGDEEQVGLDELGQQAGGKILVDHGAVPAYSPLPLSITGMPPPPTVTTTVPALIRF